MGSANTSPRLQHRVPLFREGSPEPMNSSVDSSPVAGRKPRVRVVPIEIEGDDNTKRHRNLSGSPPEDNIRKNGTSWVPEEFATSPILRSFIPDQKPKAPCERTIPIKVEGVGQSKKAKTVPVKKEKANIPKKVEATGPKQTIASPPKLDEAPVEPKLPLTDMIRIALARKKIEAVLEKLKTYHAGVEEFNGTVKDKQYRYLDEMLTRLMLELDDVETMGNEEVRLSRKAAVRKVQASVDLLETKVTRGASEKPAEESAKDQDVDMGVASSQEESCASDPAEGNCQVKEELSAGEVDQAEKTQDVEMESNAEGSQVLPDTSGETTVVRESGEYQAMEVDADAEPVITTADSSIEEPECSEQPNVVSNVTIEEVDSESGKESEHVLLANEPVVSSEDCSVRELESELELDTTTTDVVVPTLGGEAKELKMDSDIISSSTDCVKELVNKSCDVDAGINVSNLENSTLVPNEHSKDIINEAP